MRTQEQHFCRNCNKSTLHTRERAEINHVLHALLSILCCGLWLWVWLILALSRKTYPWMCSVCGHEWGEYSEREHLEDHKRKAVDRARKTKERDERKAARQAERNDPQRIAAARERAEQRKQALSSAKESIIAQIVNALKQADSGLKILAGDDEFFHQMLRVALVAVMLAMAVAIGYFVVGGMLVWMFGVT